MPRKGSNAAAKRAEPVKPIEHVKPVEPEEQLDLDGESDADESLDEEVEYEEIEEEVEEEEEEEVEEIEEEEEPEEEEPEEEEEVAATIEVDVEENAEDDMKDDGENDGVERKKHAEILALPPHGSEVFVGGIPHDASEEDLKAFCETIGEVHEVRVMKGRDSGENKGYAFVTYRTKELALKAIEDLNSNEFKGRKIKVSTSQAKYRLFIGNVPKNWVLDDMKKAVTKVGPGVTNVDLMKDPHNSSRNRGFAFIEYYNTACAEYSRKKMTTPKFKLDSNAPTVSWADPRSGDSSSNSQVKAIYIKNLPKNVTQDQLKELFQHHGDITKVILPPAKSGQENSRFGFVHFAERSMAMKALKNTEKYEMDGQVLECSLAKPPSDKKDNSGSSAQKSALLPSYPPRAYNMGAYGLPAGYGAAQSVIYGRAPSPAGVAMVPMILPDGRLGYVLQQPGTLMPTSQQRGGNRSGNSSGGRQSGDSNRGRKYRPY